MQNARLDESQVGVKTAGRNINNLMYADDTTLMAESEEELKSLLMKAKQEHEKTDLKLAMKNTKVMASNAISSCQIEKKKEWLILFSRFQNHCGWWLQSQN